MARPGVQQNVTSCNSTNFLKHISCIGVTAQEPVTLCHIFTVCIHIIPCDRRVVVTADEHLFNDFSVHQMPRLSL